MHRALTFLIAATLSSAQWFNEPARGVPRTRDGKPVLTAPAPRAGGKPDFTGLWQTDTAPAGEIEKIVPGLGQFISDWPLWALVPFVAALLIANRVFRIRDRREQATRNAAERAERR